jgi:hypothetical protein
LHAILIDCFLLGLLHGIVPDEHTWPITFSYAIGSGGSWQGMRRGIYFAGAFTLQRALLSELAWFALASFLHRPGIQAAVYIAVGAAMTLAGWLLLRRGRYGHIHLLGHHHGREEAMEPSGAVLGRSHAACDDAGHDDGEAALPARWTIVHGFIAGFGIGGFAVYVNGVAAPAMPSAWAGFLPGLIFGLGTVAMLALIGAAFGAAVPAVTRWRKQDVQRFGAHAGALMLFAGGFLYAVAGILVALGVGRHWPVAMGTLVIAAFLLAVALPALVYAWRKAPRPSAP